LVEADEEQDPCATDFYYINSKLHKFKLRNRTTNIIQHYELAKTELDTGIKCTNKTRHTSTELINQYVM